MYVIYSLSAWHNGIHFTSLMNAVRYAKKYGMPPEPHIDVMYDHGKRLVWSRERLELRSKGT